MISNSKYSNHHALSRNLKNRQNGEETEGLTGGTRQSIDDGQDAPVKPSVIRRLDQEPHPKSNQVPRLDAKYSKNIARSDTNRVPIES